MKFEITEQAKQSPLLISLPTTGEWVGVGAPYLVNDAARCPSCNEQELVAFEAANKNVKPRQYREALPHEYALIAEQYKASHGIPGYLIIIPERQAEQLKEQKKEV